MRRAAALWMTLVLTPLACEEQVYVQTDPPILLLNSESVDFGEIPVGSEVEKGLTVVNAGDEALEVTRLVVTGGSAAVFAVNTEHLTVEVGGEALVRVSFAPTAIADYEAVLELRSNASNAAVKSVALSGSGVDATVCGPCDTPPQPGCLTEFNRVTYDPNGECVNGECRYQARVERCEQGCDPATRFCVGVSYDAAVRDVTPAGDSAAPIDAAAQDDSGRDAGAGLDLASGADAAPPMCGAAHGTNDLHNYVEPGEHAFVVPAGVQALQVAMWGGGGAGGNQIEASGGGAGFVAATVAVSPGETLRVLVGQGGYYCDENPYAAGDGGGASYLLRGQTPLLIAAGGGGGGSDGCSGCKQGGAGGAGGGLDGQTGEDLLSGFNGYCTQATGGAGATQGAGGSGGTTAGTGEYQCDGTAGTRDTGGVARGTFGDCLQTGGAFQWQSGGGQRNGGGGGGGAGWYGGGAAGFIWTYCAGGGGGGSSYSDPANLDTDMRAGFWQAQGNSSEESGGAGRGGDPQGNGQHGKVVMTW